MAVQVKQVQKQDELMQLLPTALSLVGGAIGGPAGAAAGNVVGGQLAGDQTPAPKVQTPNRMDAVASRLGQTQNDPSTQLHAGLQSLQTQPPEIRAAMEPGIRQALVQSQKQQQYGPYARRQGPFDMGGK